MRDETAACPARHPCDTVASTIMFVAALPFNEAPYGARVVRVSPVKFYVTVEPRQDVPRPT